MLPVFGPDYKQTYKGGYANSNYVYKERYRQAEPYDLNLPYRLLNRTTLSAKTQVEFPPLAWTWSGSMNSPLDRGSTGDIYYGEMADTETNALNSAIKKFNKGMGDRASLGAALAQRKETIDMIGKRAKQLFEMTRALKKFDVPGAAKALGLSIWEAKKRHRQWARAGKAGPYKLANIDVWDPDFKASVKRRDRVKSFANLWLEFSFGWAPSVDDVRTAVKILSQGPPPAASLKMSAASDRVRTYTTSIVNPSYVRDVVARHAMKVIATVGGTITVSNEDKSLASKLGLTSLAAIAYEVTPFSFIANYFVNIEEWLSQFSQYEGVTVSQAWYTTRWEDTGSFRRTHTDRYSPYKVTVVCEYEQRCIDVKRIVGSLPTTRLTVRPVYHNGINRALNNVSLLVGMLGRR